MPRFFRPLAEGAFDKADVGRHTNELAGFIAEAREANDLAAPVAVGFSNGANIAAALFLLRPEALTGAVLLRAMVPLTAPGKVDLAGKPVPLLFSGQVDPIAPADNARRLAALLRERGGKVEYRMLPSAHDLGQADIALVKSWFQAIKTDGVSRSTGWRAEKPFVDGQSLASYAVFSMSWGPP